mgnify:CR=1 FL=1
MINLLDFDVDSLTAWFAQLGEKPFRARQVLRWMHRFGADDFGQMTDVAKSLRAKLAEMAEIRGPVPLRDTTAADGTRKWLLDVDNGKNAGNAVETVFIPEANRGTLCISSQVGCTLTCTFCHTGTQKLVRNLEVEEIVGQILLPKDYIRYCLTGEYAMDKADGSGTILFDLKKRDWSAEIVDSLQIRPEWLPQTFEGCEFTGAISKSAARVTGLVEGTPVAAGGGDQEAQAVGVGAVEPGIIGLTVGTSGVVFATTPSALIEPQGRLHAFCHSVPGAWHFMGVMLSAAGSLQWYRDTLAPDLDFNQLIDEALDIPAGSEGLQFLPYLSGERTPYPDPYARGAFIGLTIRHTRAHMTRSVLEGVAFGFKDMFALIQNSGLKEITQIRASGGGTKSRLWRQILASVLESTLVTVNTTEGAAFGAALLAGVGAGVWSDTLTACKQSVKITGQTTPLYEDIETYRAAYGVYRELYPALKTIFTRM